MLDCLDDAAHLCAATGRSAEALTLWAAHTSLAAVYGPELEADIRRRAEPARAAAGSLGPRRAREAERRGEAMTLRAAAEFAGMLAGAGPHPAGSRAGVRLTPRERELVTLVAQGRTDAEIAVELFISIRTVRSHLDRIRDKTGSRRRADLTRLALRAGLV